MYTESLELFAALLAFNTAAAEPPPPVPPAPVVRHVAAPEVTVAPALPGDDNGDGRIDEDESGWNCRTMGNQVCGTGYIAPDGSREVIDFTNPTPVVRVIPPPPELVAVLPVPGPVVDYYPNEPAPAPTEITETIQTETGHVDLDDSGNVRNASESDQAAAVEAINNRAGASIEGNVCVWRNEAGHAVSASTDLSDCG